MEDTVILGLCRDCRVYHIDGIIYGYIILGILVHGPQAQTPCL